MEKLVEWNIIELVKEMKANEQRTKIRYYTIDLDVLMNLYNKLSI